MDGRQELIPVAQMVFAELPGRVTERLKQLGNRRVFLLQTERRTGEANLGQAGAQAGLAGDKRRSPGRTTLLGIVIREHHAFLGDAVDVGRLVTHHAVRVGADVRLPDVIAPDDDDVGFLGVSAVCGAAGKKAADHRQGEAGGQNTPELLHNYVPLS